MVFNVTPHDSQEVQNWHNLGAAQNQLRYQTLNNYLKDMRQMTEERYKEWLRVLNTLYQIYPHVLQSQSKDALKTLDNNTEKLYRFLQIWPTGMAPQQPITQPSPPPSGQGPSATTQPQAAGLPATFPATASTNQQQSNQQQSGQQTNQQNP